MERFYYSFLKAITRMIEREGVLSLPKFGLFKVTNGRPGSMWSPMDGKWYEWDSRVKLAFIPSPSLKQHFRNLDKKGKLKYVFKNKHTNKILSSDGIERNKVGIRVYRKVNGEKIYENDTSSSVPYAKLRKNKDIEDDAS